MIVKYISLMIDSVAERVIYKSLSVKAGLNGIRLKFNWL